MSENTYQHGHQGKVQIEVAEPVRALPIHDEMERRAIALKMAIDARPITLRDLREDATTEELAFLTVKAARVFEAYISGE